MRAPFSLLVPVAAALTAGCGDTFISTSSDGRIEVAVSSSGTGFDDDGFSITVDGGTTEFLVSGGTATLTGLAPGSHVVLLTGLAENCVAEGANPRTVTVRGDGTASVAFAVHCDPARTGTLSVTISTIGQPADTDGYRLVVGEGGVRFVASSATETFTALPAGVRLVMLKDLAPGCVLDGGNPQPAVVIAGRTATLSLRIRCGGSTR
jgi:hypothetical protein